MKNTQEYKRSHDMPHEHLMDESKVSYEDLNTSIKADIRRFDKTFDKALKDGFVDENEEKELIASSYKIAQRIKTEHLKAEEATKNNTGLIGGVVIGVGLAFLALFGINQMKE